MSVTDEHCISPSKVLTKSKKAPPAEVDKDGDKDVKQGGKINKKSNALVDFISRNKKPAADKD
jgi:hypothetical protein